MASFFETAPERDRDTYGSRARRNAAICWQHAGGFFKDAVKQARDRNIRAVKSEQMLAEAQSAEAQDSIIRNASQLESKYLRFLRTSNKADDFEIVKLIGKGAFGEVKLVRQKRDRKVYALKCLSKTHMVAGDQVARVRAERDILAESDSLWVVKLFTTFQDVKFLYLLMEFLPGGDLMAMLIEYDIFTEDITRFYIAEIIMAIEAVHKMGFVHRDIKPDNILLDRAGHVKLTDFGLSTGFRKVHDINYYRQLLSQVDTTQKLPSDHQFTVNIDQINLTVSNRAQIKEWRRSRRLVAYSTVGTPDYIAPEVLRGEGCSFDCDWWSLGTIMFECLVGWPPFCAEDRCDVYRKIVNWPQYLQFPPDARLSQESVGLMTALMQFSEARLGRHGAHDIKAHAFFTGVDFNLLRQIRAPFEPRLESEVDTAYFPVKDLEAQARDAVAVESSKAHDESPELTLPFIGYTFKRFENNYR